LVVLALGLVTALVQAARAKPHVTWLVSETPSIELGVWDKSGAAGAYQVTFEVKEPGGTRYLARKRSPANAGFCEVTFPHDFFHYEKDGRFWRAAELVPGDYSLTARVKGHSIIKERFRVTGSGSTRTISIYD
jgi:hypothetical protein